MLLIHGFTGSVDAWGDDLIRGLAESGLRRRRVLAVDLPGHGQSDVPGDPGRYGMTRIVDDLVEVLDHVNVSRADWVGYSMGGRVALGAAVLQPDRVRRLVLEGASPGIDDEEEAAARRDSDEALAASILEEGMDSFVDAWMAIPLFRTQERLPDERRARERRRRLACDPLGLANTLRGLGTGRQSSFWDALPETEIPTLLLTGAQDEKFTRLARRMAARMPDATHIAVPAAGHTVHLERPGSWLRAIVGFLDAGELEGEPDTRPGPKSRRTPSHRGTRSDLGTDPGREKPQSENTPSTQEGGRTR